jgi:hypothetical protein
VPASAQVELVPCAERVQPVPAASLSGPDPGLGWPGYPCLPGGLWPLAWGSSRTDAAGGWTVLWTLHLGTDLPSPEDPGPRCMGGAPAHPAVRTGGGDRFRRRRLPRRCPPWRIPQGASRTPAPKANPRLLPGSNASLKTVEQGGKCPPKLLRRKPSAGGPGCSACACRWQKRYRMRPAREAGLPSGSCPVQ